MIPLLWKSWREHRWKAAALCAMFAVPLIGGKLLDRHNLLNEPAIPQMFVAMLSCFATIWFAARDIAGEHLARTHPTLEALPISRARLFLVRTFTGLLASLVPSMIALWLAQSIFHDMHNSYFQAFFWTDLDLYLVLVFLAGATGREGFIALLGVLLLLGIFILGGALYSFFRGSDEAWIYAFSPATMLNEPDPAVAASAIPLQFLVALGLGALAFLRHLWLPGRGSPTAPHPAPPPGARIICPAVTPFQSRPFLPLAWKEWREQYPLVMATGFVAIALASLIAVVDAVGGYHPQAWASGETFFEMLTFIAAVAPTIVAVMLGISAFSEDLQDSLSAFWRTRPFSGAQLFRVKYLTALVGVFTLLALLGLFGAFGLWGTRLLWNIPASDLPRGNNPLRIAFGQLFWLPFVLMLAAACMVLLRKTIPASIIAVVIILALVYVPITRAGEFASILMTWPLSTTPFWAAAALLLTTTLLLGMIVHNSFTTEPRHPRPTPTRSSPLTGAPT